MGVPTPGWVSRSRTHPPGRVPAGFAKNPVTCKLYIYLSQILFQRIHCISLTNSIITIKITIKIAIKITMYSIIYFQY